jgi:hypothetical protein
VRNQLRFTSRNGTRAALVRRIGAEFVAAGRNLCSARPVRRHRGYLALRGLVAPIFRTDPGNLYRLDRPRLQRRPRDRRLGEPDSS